MKKLLLIPALLLTSQLSFGQIVSSQSSIITKVAEPPKPKKPIRLNGLQYTIEVQPFTGLGAKKDYSSSKITSYYHHETPDALKGGNLKLAFTYKIDGHLAVGAGVGIGWLERPEILRSLDITFNDPLETPTHRGDLQHEYMSDVRIDAFVRATYRFLSPQSRISPFIGVDLGLHNYTKRKDDDISRDFNIYYNRSYTTTQQVQTGTSYYGPIYTTETVNHTQGLDQESLDQHELKVPTSTFFFAPSVGLSWRATANSYWELKAGFDITSGFKEQTFEGKVMETTYSNYTYQRTGPTEVGTYTVKFDKTTLSTFFVSIGFTRTLNLFSNKTVPQK